MLYQLLRLVENIPGDTAECGVYKGADSYLICKVNESRVSDDRMHFIFDSFEGVSAPTSADESYWNKGDLSCAEDVVKRSATPEADTEGQGYKFRAIPEDERETGKSGWIKTPAPPGDGDGPATGPDDVMRGGV